MTAPQKKQVSSNPQGNGDTSGLGNGSLGNGNGYTVKQQAPDQDVDDVNAQLGNAGQSYDRETNTIKKTGKDALNNIKAQRKANAKQLLMKNNQINRSSDWQPNQQKEQSTYAALRRTMGNAAYGSGLADLNEGMARYDDMQDKELIETWKDNQNNAYNNWYQANADLIADYNSQVVRTNEEFDNAYNTYLSNIAGINSKLGKQAYAYDDTSDKTDASIKRYNSKLAALNARNKVSNIKSQINSINKQKKITKADQKKLASLKKQLKTARTKYSTALKNNNNAIKIKVGDKSYNLSTKKGLANYSKALSETSKKKVSNSKALKTAINKTKKNIQSLNDKRKLSTTINEGKDTIKVTLRKEKSPGLKTITNKARASNPNIPNSKDGATDYIRGTNEVKRSRIKMGDSEQKNSVVKVGKKTYNNRSGANTGGNANSEGFDSILSKSRVKRAGKGLANKY